MKKIIFIFASLLIFVIKPTISIDPIMVYADPPPPIPSPSPFPVVSPSPAPVLLSHQQEVELDALDFCESRGKSNIRVLDTDGYYSYGNFQFHLSTFIKYGIKYGLLNSTITQDEARHKIMDYNLQYVLTANMLKDGLWRNWYNCMKRMNP